MPNLHAQARRFANLQTRRVKTKTIALLFPALFVVVWLFGGGLLLVAANSFAALHDSVWTFAAYSAILQSREIRAAFGLTVFVAVVSTVLATTGGAALAILLHTAARNNKFLKTLLQIPIAIPHLAAALVLLNLLEPSGLIARLFVKKPQDFPVLVNDAFGVGIIAAFVLKEIPFVALVVLSNLARANDEFWAVAENLGANSWQRFRFVTLPVIAPSLKFASLIVFAFVFGAFEIPFVLGRQFPALLAVVGNRKFASVDLIEKSEAFALAVLMIVAASVFVWIYLRITGGTLDADKTAPF